MKQALSPAGRAALQRQLCSPYNFIDPDEEIIERMMQAKAVYFWEATAMELSYARELIRHGIEILSPEPGWEIESAAILVTADQSAAADLSLGLVEELSDAVMESFSCPSFTFGAAFSDLDIGALRLVLAAAGDPVRVPQTLTRLSLGSLSILAGGTRLERETLMGDFMDYGEYIADIILSVSDTDLKALRDKWDEIPLISISEAHLVDGKEQTARQFSDMLLYRFHKDLPTVLGMQYIPKCFDKWFPMERMRQEVLESPL